jgi:caffeoyl-CoA O-methyltransferase
VAGFVPPAVEAVMAELEAIDRRDRVDGTPKSKRLRAISPDVGRFLMTLALGVGARTILEVGTSGGYSTLWLAVAARHRRGRVVTFEVDPAKVDIACRAIDRAGLGETVEVRLGDGGAGLADFEATADLVFLDAEKEEYERFLEPAVRALRPGGILVADNILSHPAELAGFREAALGHPALTGLVVPIGRGELVAVKL